MNINFTVLLTQPQEVIVMYDFRNFVGRGVILKKKQKKKMNNVGLNSVYQIVIHFTKSQNPNL